MRMIGSLQSCRCAAPQLRLHTFRALLPLRSPRPLFEAAGNGEAPPARRDAAALQKRSAFLLYFGTEKASTPKRETNILSKPELHFRTNFTVL
jgi:hypothetical protein